MNLALRVLCLLLLLARALPLSAEAQADDPIARGVALRREGKNAEALAEFRRAYERAPSPRALAQIALAEQALGHWPEAERGLSDALAAQTDAWIARNANVLASALDTVREHLASLYIESDLPGASVRIAGNPVGTTPLSGPLRLAVGETDVEASLPDRPAQRAHVTLVARGEHHIRITFAQPPSGPPPGVVAPAAAVPPPALATQAESPSRGPEHDTSPSARRSGLRIGGIVTVVAGSVLLGAGVAAQLVNQHYVHQYNSDSYCSADEYDCSRIAERAELAKKLAIAGFVTGGAALAAGVVMLVVARRDNAKRLSVQPSVGTRAWGVLVQRAF